MRAAESPPRRQARAWRPAVAAPTARPERARPGRHVGALRSRARRRRERRAAWFAAGSRPDATGAPERQARAAACAGRTRHGSRHRNGRRQARSCRGAASRQRRQAAVRRACRTRPRADGADLMGQPCPPRDVRCAGAPPSGAPPWGRSRRTGPGRARQTRARPEPAWTPERSRPRMRMPERAPPARHWAAARRAGPGWTVRVGGSRRRCGSGAGAGHRKGVVPPCSFRPPLLDTYHRRITVRGRPVRHLVQATVHVTLTGCAGPDRHAAGGPGDLPRTSPTPG